MDRPAQSVRKEPGSIAVTWIPVQITRGAFRDVPGSIRRLRAAYQRGKRSRMLLGVSFDELWDRPVAELAKELCD
jgi:ubiquinone biosynthesis protein COQ4